MFESDSVWVLASAGTGKTKNLIDRILALLVRGVKPSKILCLTYTKNATAEMLIRLNDCIAKWMETTDGDVREDLKRRNLPEDLYPRAKQLYQLSTSEKWVRIQTIHGFCQELINLYPLEADIMPRSRILDDIYPLLKEAYVRVLHDEAYHKDIEFVLQYKSSILDTIVENFHDIRKFFEHYNVSPDLYDQFFMVKYHSEDEILADLCTPAHADLIEEVKEYFSDQSAKFATFPSFDFTDVFLTAEGKPSSRVLKSSKTKHIADKISTLADLAYELNENRNRLLIAKLNTAFMNVTRAVIQRYEEIKRANSAIDFDDIIIKANRMMQEYDYIRQTVDGMIDHVLIDEAQDTSAIQWEVIKSITGDFFAHENSQKTLFVVGDKKQSIYSFQGANFELFLSMHDYFKQKVTDCGQKWHDITLNTSYRSGQAIIDFVNRSFCGIFPDSEHFTSRIGTPSQVVVNPVYHLSDDAPLNGIAQQIAEYVKEMIDSKRFLPSKQRAAEPRDFMILSQRRSELHGLIANALKKRGIPCSGSDKIDIKEELIIEDLISIAKFSTFQYDDLNLAIILKCPIFDIPEDELFQICTQRDEDPLWKYLVSIGHKYVSKLQQYIESAYLPPYEFFMKMVENGDIDLLASRCGTNATEAFNAFLDICRQYPGPASLQSFIRWYNESDFITKKDKLSSGNAVSIMTVHGSKGLQAPVVILIDTAFINRKYAPIVDCGNDFIFLNHSEFATARIDDIAEVIQAKENAESKRLLYVAATRAEDVLSVYAHTSFKDVNPESWYAILGGERTMGQDLVSEGRKVTSARHIPTQIYNSLATKPIKSRSMTYMRSKKPFMRCACGGWGATHSAIRIIKHGNGTIATNPFPELPPLAPIKDKETIKTEQEIYGDFVHLLLEKLPDISRGEWGQFMAEQEVQLSEDSREMAYNEAIKVIDTFRDIFHNSIASELEVTTKGRLRRIDKVCLINGEIYVIDFKTGIEDASQYAKQLREYKEILKASFPNHTIRAFVLWTKSLELTEISHNQQIEFQRKAADARGCGGPRPAQFEL